MSRTLFAAAFIVVVACGTTARTMTASGSPPGGPTEAARTSPSIAPTPSAASAAHVALYGDVQDGRPLATNPNLVVPNDLMPVAGATVSIPGLGLSAMTDARGTFDVDLGEVASDCATDVIVQATGFGLWTLHAAPIWTYEHSGGGIRLYIQLSTKAQENIYTHKFETPRPGCVRVGSAIRGN